MIARRSSTAAVSACRVLPHRRPNGVLGLSRAQRTTGPGTRCLAARHGFASSREQATHGTTCICALCPRAPRVLTVSHPGSNLPDTPACKALAFVVGALNGDPLTGDDIRAHFSASFLLLVTQPMSSRSSRRKRRACLGGVTGFDGPMPASSLTTAVTENDSESFAGSLPRGIPTRSSPLPSDGSSVSPRTITEHGCSDVTGAPARPCSSAGCSY